MKSEDNGTVTGVIWVGNVQKDLADAAGKDVFVYGWVVLPMAPDELFAAAGRLL